jgi:D-beta-D-heptose 7-phosphate kinase/D-beta-D-heptose 1-phosphate adenosyltransferase
LGKVVSKDELIQERAAWKRGGRRVVFASGSFDLLHPGHVRFLEQARPLGDILVIAVKSDADVSRDAIAPATASEKTPSAEPSRPITPSTERAEIVAALAAVDFAVELGESTARELIAELVPDILAQAGATETDEDGRREEREAKAAGVKIVRIPLEPGHSTSRLIERIKQTGQLGQTGQPRHPHA